MRLLKRGVLDLSTLSLLASNIIVIFLALYQKWEVSTVLWVYWMQSVIIGFFQFFRILSLKKFSTENFTINNQDVLPTSGTRTYTAFFFLLHYGFFHFIYAIFIFNFFKSGETFDFVYFILGGLIFFVNHFFSFYHNRIIDEQKTQNIGKLMFAPYARIIPMHLVIIFGAILGQSSLILFLVLKTFADLLTHVRRHQK